MKMKNIYKIGLSIGVLVAFIVCLIGCDKNRLYPVTVPPSAAEFTTSSNVQTFGVSNVNATTSYTIPIGLTSKSGAATSVKVSISSPTGAVAGTQYSVSTTDITIPAGGLIDSSLVLTAKYDTYKDDRIDTLKLTIQNSNSDVVLDSVNTHLTIIIRKSCPLVITDYVGDFIVTADVWADYSVGDIITLTNVDATHFSFKDIHAINPTAISVTVNTTTNAVTIAKQTIGTVWEYGPAYTSPTMSATGTINSCDKIINLNVTYGYSAGTWSGTYLLALKKK